MNDYFQHKHDFYHKHVAFYSLENQLLIRGFQDVFSTFF